MFTAFSFEKGVLQFLPVSAEIDLSVGGKMIMWRIGDRFYEVNDIIYDVFSMFYV